MVIVLRWSDVLCATIRWRITVCSLSGEALVYGSGPVRHEIDLHRHFERHLDAAGMASEKCMVLHDAAATFGPPSSCLFSRVGVVAVTI